MAELRRIVWLALIAGVLAGTLTTAVQLFTTVPLILEAETYEHGHVPHAPSMGVALDRAMQRETLARSANTLVFNVLAGIGFGLILSALLSTRRETGVRQGIVLGAAAFLAVTLAPALGLPPELPGAASAGLNARQFWWIGTATASALGLALLTLVGRAGFRVTGLALIVLPHLIGAPHMEGVVASGPPEALQHRFVAASLGSTGLFWLILGTALGWLHRRLDKRLRSPAPHGS